ncbi:MAG: FHA domain-containing protein [Chloroflexi bacterium]|nr:FHA domain-containing protein [Chloroflexota bacterium]MBT3669400.1 FHA domain-containing protein [Chloroflexota bacterium]MBT4003294.1 FHA domain-containing protein [Chloroflexota bacterium]MBT4304581.1 FHA domain-containing protein [Chloroflexota bacterium]MBT4534078.1 FHA domain-containing protein [Chloroflexota bacterium]
MKTKNKTITKNAYLVANSQIFSIREIVSKIGRKLENDFVIQESMISRFHAEIHFKKGNYILIDKNSTGGTFLNNLRIEKSVLKSGDTIRLANTPILFLIESTDMQIKTVMTSKSLKSEKKENTSGNEKTKPYKNKPK